jgi:translation initiation factor 2 subunit 1
MYKKDSLPEKDDLVICTIKEATPSSVFVILDEYENVEGMIHVSEIARKQVRAMKVYLKPGTKLVCKVMEVDPTKRFLTLSLRRVGEGQRRSKLQEWEREKAANELLEVFGKQTKKSASDLKDIRNSILQKFKTLHEAWLQTAQNGKGVLIEAGLKPELAEQLTSLVQKRITLPKISVRGIFIIQSILPNGLTKIKESFSELIKTAEKQKLDLKITYISAPKYQFVVSSPNKKAIDDFLKRAITIFQSNLGKDSKIEVQTQ